MTVPRADAARELLRRKRAQESLHSYALSIDIPTVPFSAMHLDEDLCGPARLLMAKHHAAILDTIQRTMTRFMGRAIIMAPPGSAKSLNVDVVGATWYMGKFPGSRLMLVSYQATLAERQSRRCHQVIEQPAYQQLWNESPRMDRAAAGDWSLTNKSEYLAMGFESGLTGNRANGCFVGDTHILTPSGPVRIDAITPDTIVYGYDHTEKRIKSCRVRAVRVLKRANLVRLHTVAGRNFVCTDDHPVFGGCRYQAAGILKAGESLVCTDAVMSAMRRPETERIHRLPALLLQAAHHTHAAALRVLRRLRGAADVRMGEASKTGNSESLLQQALSGARVQSVSAQTEAAESTEAATKTSRQGVPDVRQDFSPVESVHAVLSPSVRQQGARDSYAGTRQRTVEARSGRSVSGAVLPHTAAYQDKGSGVCCLPHAKIFGVSSHRRDSGEQHARESSYAVQDTSPAGTQRDRVSLVERLRTNGELVYDIEVEGTHNFFAEGVLVHNCVIDDPVAGREKADSEAIRKKVNDAYSDDLKTRLLPGAWIILIMTRWHEADLAGFILPDDYAGESGMVKCKDGLMWEVLNIPAKCERPDDPLGRAIGEYIWPEYYPPEHWAMFEGAQGSEAARTWSALYQQRPVPQGSGRFHEQMFDFYKTGTQPPFMAYVGAGDYAVTEAGGDFTELGVFGVDPQGDLWEVDWWSKQCSTSESTEKTLDLIKKWKIGMWFNEGGNIDKAMGPLINLRMRQRKVYTDRRALVSMADKVSKCAAFQGRAASGGEKPGGGWTPGSVHFRDNANSRRVVNQLVALPAGRYDDGADVCGLIGRALDQFPLVRVPGQPKRLEGVKPFSAAWLEYQEPQDSRFRLR